MWTHSSICALVVIALLVILFICAITRRRSGHGKRKRYKLSATQVFEDQCVEPAPPCSPSPPPSCPSQSPHSPAPSTPCPTIPARFLVVNKYTSAVVITFLNTVTAPVGTTTSIANGTCQEVIVPPGAVSASFAAPNVAPSYAVPLLGVFGVSVIGITDSFIFPQPLYCG